MRKREFFVDKKRYSCNSDFQEEEEETFSAPPKKQENYDDVITIPIW